MAAASEADVLQALRRKHPAKARFAGQSQTWFLARLHDGPQAIRFDHQPPEFDAFEWVAPEEALARVVPFKREAYRQALTAFGLLSAGPV